MWKDPLSPESVEQNLKDAGCPGNFVERFLACYGDCTPEEQLQLLYEQRKELLRQVHDSQKKMDCLDYLRDQIRKCDASREKKNGGGPEKDRHKRAAPR